MRYLYSLPCLLLVLDLEAQSSAKSAGMVRTGPDHFQVGSELLVPTGSPSAPLVRAKASASAVPCGTAAGASGRQVPGKSTLLRDGLPTLELRVPGEFIGGPTRESSTGVTESLWASWRSTVTDARPASRLSIYVNPTPGFERVVLPPNTTVVSRHECFVELQNSPRINFIAAEVAGDLRGRTFYLLAYWRLGSGDWGTAVAQTFEQDATDAMAETIQSIRVLR